MSPSVLTWCDRESLGAALKSNPRFEKALHLCATQSLRQGLAAKHECEAPFAVTIGRLIDELCAPWFSARTHLRQYIGLTGILRELQRAYPAHARELRSLRRGQRDVLAALRDLVQAGLRPGDVRAATDVEAMACRAWEELEKHAGFNLPRTRLYEQFVERPDTFAHALEQAVRKKLDSRRTEFDRTLMVLHGFYFITPIQFQLMRLLQAVGIELVFLNFHDPRFPQACRAWEAFFLPEFGLPPVQAWKPQPPAGPPAVFAQQLGEALSGKPFTFGESAAHIIFEEYPDLSGFARAISTRQREEGELPPIFSPDSDELTHRLAEFLPEAVPFGRRHLLAYPLGRFLLHLHGMWNAERSSINIDAVALAECIGSGWMRLDGKDAREFLPTVERLLPYFEGCRALEQWLERAEQLRRARQALVESFRARLEGASVVDRYERFLVSPFERLSFLAVPEEELTGFTRLLRELHGLAQRMFAGPDTRLSAHFEKLASLLRECVDPTLLYEEERKLLEVLQDSLEETQLEDLLVPREDLSEAVALFLSGGLEPADGEEESGVSPFSRLDGAALELGEGELHLALCDDELLPHRYTGIAWPFERESMHPAQPAARQSCALLRAREESALDADVLLLFQAAALSGKELTVSWVQNRRNQELGPSTLLLPLLHPFGPYQPRRAHGLTALDAPAAPRGSEWKAVSRSPPAAESLPPQALAEWVICPRRFFYDFVLADGPEWRSDFHHSFLLGNLVRGLEKQFGLGGQVLSQLTPYLPHWPDARLKAACESAPPPPEGRFTYRGRAYPAFLNRLVLYDGKAPDANRIRRVLNGEEQRQVGSMLNQRASQLDGAPLPAAQPSTHCSRCPHQHHCDSARSHHEPTDT